MCMERIIKSLEKSMRRSELSATRLADYLYGKGLNRHRLGLGKQYYSKTPNSELLTAYFKYDERGVAMITKIELKDRGIVIYGKNYEDIK